MESTISKNIIQIWGGESDLPMLAKASAKYLKLLNPDFKYILFDDDLMKDFIHNYFPEFMKVFKAFHIPIQQYDFFRYLAIYKLGGFYFDMDILITQELDSLLKYSCVFPFERLTWSDYLREKCKMDWEIGNYAFGAAKRHPFIYQIIQNCIKAQNNITWRDEILKPLPRLLRKDLYVIYTTGPGLVTRTLAEYYNKKFHVKVLFPDDVCDKEKWNKFGDYGVHLMQSSWRDKKRNFKRRIIDYLEVRNEKYAIEIAKKYGKKRHYTK